MSCYSLENDVSSLNTLIAKISDQYIKDYLEEGIKCLSINALRASVVFLWSGTVRDIQQKLLCGDNKKLNAAIQKHDPKARNVGRIDHFAYIKDKVTLLAALEVGILDKNEKDILEEALNLRNKCGHPGKYKLGPKKVSSFIEDIINIVFS